MAILISSHLAIKSAHENQSNLIHSPSSTRIKRGMYECVHIEIFEIDRGNEN